MAPTRGTLARSPIREGVGGLPEAMEAPPQKHRPTEEQPRAVRAIGREPPPAHPEAPPALLERAKEILDGNWVGDHTVPAPGLYPHQWNWDTGFIAIGRSRYDQTRAETEMLSLFRGQWRTGMLPHIVFNDDVPADAYFPGPDFWLCPEVASDAPPDVSTSGLTQPPVHAFAALEMHRRAADHEQSVNFLKRLYPHLSRLHDYFLTRRVIEPGGLAAIVHPWESGMDNSPAWDGAFTSFEVPADALPAFERRDLVNADPRDRPSDEAYRRFVYLALLYRDSGYEDGAIADITPFLVEDPTTNAIWAWSAHALAEIAGIVGEDGVRFREEGERLTAAIEERLWQERPHRFVPFDLRRREKMPHHSIVSFMPLVAPGIDRDKAHLTVHAMDDIRHCRRQPCYPLPSFDLHDEEFDPRRYWRGPIWINTNWLLYRGCRAVGEEEKAEELRAAILELVRASGFREYYDPHGDDGYGADRFSWTAALYLDVAMGG